MKSQKAFIMERRTEKSWEKIYGDLSGAHRGKPFLLMSTAYIQ
ncbi:MAG: hypothetical protein R2860_09040 [Desulfobacterales bacterium]